MSDLDIPAFLLIPPAERAAGWRGRRLTQAKQGKAAQSSWHLPKSMDAACWALVREAERDKERKKQESLAALRAWKEANRR